jgi:DNA-binding transcriptional MerR regulator
MKKLATNKTNEVLMNEGEFLLSSEVARIKDVTPATVRQWEQRGLLPAKRTASGTRIFSRSEVEKFQPPRRHR